MANQYRPLTMADVVETESIRASKYGPTEHYVYVLMAPAEALERYTEASIADYEGGQAVLRLPLGEITDAPRCDYCGCATPDLTHYVSEAEDDSYDGCAGCSPESLYADAALLAAESQADAERWW